MVSRTLYTLMALCLLVACTPEPKVEALRTMTPTGDAYQVALANNYKQYAGEFAARYEWDTSNYFGDKALRAAQGEQVDPEDPGVWKFNEAELKELTEMREKLMRAVATNRTVQPEVTASAVIAYDRWLVLRDQNIDSKAIAEQQDILASLMGKLEQAHVASESADIPPPTIPAEAERTVLYFPFDSDQLGDSALAALAQLAQTIPDADDVAIAINGHADRAGPEAYNMKLSERRAMFVQKALEKAGVPSKRMSHYAFGETDPAVPTADGVAEPKNRRVEVTVE